MGFKAFSWIAVPLAALALVAQPAFGFPQESANVAPRPDVSANAPQKMYKNYALNGATGDFAPQVDHPQPSVRVVQVTKPRGFAWDASIAGAGATLLVVLIAGATTRRVRRRRIAAPSPAHPAI